MVKLRFSGEFSSVFLLLRALLTLRAPHACIITRFFFLGIVASVQIPVC